MENENKKQKKANVNKKNSSKSNSRRTLLIVLIIIILIVVVALLVRNAQKNNDSSENTAGNESKESYVEEIEDGVKINKSTKLNEAKEINGLLITNIQLTTIDGMTTLLADVTNNSGAPTQLQTIKITLLAQDGSELTTVTGIVKDLAVGETTELNISVTSDFVNAYDFRVSL